MNFQKKLLIVALFGTIFAVFLQEQNLQFLANRYPASHGLLTSADEASYFAPAINVLEKGTWKDNSIGQSAYFQRTPGYGLVYLFCLVIAGKKAFWMLKLLQILAFSGSIFLFGNILEKLLKNSKFALSRTMIYTFFPAFSGFMYFTLTESFTPFLVLWSVFAGISLQDKKSNFSWNFLFANSIMLLFRPQLIVFLLAFLAYYFFQNQRKKAVFTLLAILPLLIWNIRTVTISGTWLGIHPIYSKTNNTLFRPSHEAMTNLFRIWEADGAKFHVTIHALIDSADIHLITAQIPEKYREKVTPILVKYRALYNYQLTHFDQNKPISGTFQGEEKFMLEISALTKKLKSENKIDYYLLTPVQSLKKLMLSSHLNLGIYQFKYRGTWWLETIRWSCLTILIASFMATLFALFKKNRDLIFYLSLAIIVNLFYLIFIQRMNEERYLTPFLPIALIVLLVGIFNHRKKPIS
jgi:hypothetical protein